MANRKKTNNEINLNTLNLFAEAIESSLKEKQEAHREELNNMASELKNMVDAFENQGFSHEDAMDLVKAVIGGSIPRGGKE